MSGNGGDGGGDVPWPWSKDIRPVPFPLLGTPVFINDLKGKICRVIAFGDKPNADRKPGRVTIFLNKDGRIEQIYLEPDLPEI